MSYSHLHLLLYPYHLACKIVRGLRITPFQYYITIMESIMEQERSYDSLPNFTAADCKFWLLVLPFLFLWSKNYKSEKRFWFINHMCWPRGTICFFFVFFFCFVSGLRLLGIGRNEYIDLMNQCRSGRKLFRKKNVRTLLPPKPIDINIEPWWRVQYGYIVEEDVKVR